MSYKHTNEADMFSGFNRLATQKEAKTIFETAISEGAAISDFSDSQLRAMAMSLVLAWVSMGDYSYPALEGGAATMADLDENEEITDDEQDEMNDLLQAVADAFVSAGADPANVTAFIDDESAEAGVSLGEFLSGKMENVTQSDEELIATYATSGDIILEGTIKVIRGGKITLKKKRIGIPHKMNSLQKASLKKARSKAFTGAARAKRKKSLHIRQKMGL